MSESRFDPGAGAGGIGGAVAADSGAQGGPEPWEVVGWTLVFPGLGHVRLGRVRRGVLLAAACPMLGIAAIATLLAPRAPLHWAILAFAAAAGLQIWAMFDAHRIGRRSLSPEADAARRAQRDVWKALLLTRLLPGLGHIYDGRILPGLGFLLGTVLLGMLLEAWEGVTYVVVLALASTELWYHFRGRRGGPTSWMWRLLVATIVVCAIQPGIKAVLQATTVRAYRVVSESLSPTLQAGDCIFLDVTQRGHADLGEVVALPPPGQPTEVFLERVLAREGDVVEFRRDGAWRNGHLVLRPPVLAPARYGELPFAGAGDPFRVPAGQVFVVGDNLANSYDSRFFGPVPERSTMGRAAKIYWPPARVGAIAEFAQLVR